MDNTFALPTGHAITLMATFSLIALEAQRAKAEIDRLLELVAALEVHHVR